MRRRASEAGRAVWRSGGRLAAAALFLTARPPDRLSAQGINNSGALFLVFPVGARGGEGAGAARAGGRRGGGLFGPAGARAAGAERGLAPERDARGGRDPHPPPALPPPHPPRA